MMGEVSLSRFEQLFLGVAGELRPALAKGNPSMSVLERGHSTLVPVARFHLARPTESVGLWYPGVHGRHDVAWPLSIRFQIVAGVG
jgi:hypothetical protein